MGDPADQSVYSADTFSRRCEGLGFSSDRIYCLPCPRLLSTVFQSACCVINVLKLCTHTHTLTGDFLCEWKRGNKPSSNVSDLSQRKNAGKTERMKYTAKCGINKKTNQEIMTQVKSPGDSRKPKLPPLSSVCFTSMCGQTTADT